MSYAYLLQQETLLYMREFLYRLNNNPERGALF